jgi:Zn-dependent protease
MEEPLAHNPFYSRVPPYALPQPAPGPYESRPLGAIERRRGDWPPPRRIATPLLLFAATATSTFLAGALAWDPVLAFVEPEQAGKLIAVHWREGVQYMAAFLAILLAHELGHFLQAVRYRVPTSWPYFIPAPFIPTGSMGAVINMWGAYADRKQLFDIGVTGPWAGLAVALPIVCVGLSSAPLDVLQSDSMRLGDPLIFKLLTLWLRPELPYGAALEKTPLLMAGWIGMLITGLNMLPVSQFDGGHVIHGLFGRRSIWIARSVVIAAILVMVITDDYQWVVMLVLALLLGVDHPPTRDDTAPLGWPRRLVGYASLALPIFCFTPKIL